MPSRYINNRYLSSIAYKMDDNFCHINYFSSINHYFVAGHDRVQAVPPERVHHPEERLLVAGRGGALF